MNSKKLSRGCYQLSKIVKNVHFYVFLYFCIFISDIFHEIFACLLVGSNVNNTKKMFLIPKNCYIWPEPWLKNGEIFHFPHEIMSFVLVLTRLVVRMRYLLFTSVVLSAHYSIESLSSSVNFRSGIRSFRHLAKLPFVN